MRTISKQQAARFLLLHHGLIGPYRYTGKDGALAFIRSVGSIQYDPTTNYQGDLSFIMSKKPATGQIA